MRWLSLPLLLLVSLVGRAEAQDKVTASAGGIVKEGSDLVLSYKV